MNMGIETQVHPEYTLNVDKWRAINDCESSSLKTSQYRQNYAIKPSHWDAARYNDYVNRGYFFNAVKPTVSGYVGLINEVAAEVELQPEIECLLDNADGGGLSLEQMVNGVDAEVVKNGRSGVLVDPTLESSVTAVYMRNYDADCILDWQESYTANGKELTYIKLLRVVSEIDMDNYHRADVRYVDIFKLVDSKLIVEHYKDGAMMVVAHEPMYQRKPMNWIPFYFAGSENNDSTVDVAPLFALADCDIAHFRNSCDYEENSNDLSAGILSVTSDLSPEDFGSANGKDGLKLGSKSYNFLGKTGAIAIAQPSPNTVARQAMEDKKADMAMLGAQLIQPSATETATAVNAKARQNSASLVTISRNVSSMIEDALYCASKLMKRNGEPKRSVYQQHSDFSVMQLTAQDRQQWLMEVQQGISPVELMRVAYRKARVYPDDWTDEMIDAAIMAGADKTPSAWAEDDVQSPEEAE